MTRRNGHPRPANGKKTALASKRKTTLQEQIKSLDSNSRNALMAMLRSIDDSDVAETTQGVYYAAQGEQEMPVKTAPTRKERRLLRNATEMPGGTKWFQIIARGVRRKREEMGLTTAECARRLDMHHHAWRNVEIGQLPNTTGANLQDILDFFHMDLTKLYELGKPLP